jgi:hypothetical protein
MKFKLIYQHHNHDFAPIEKELKIRDLEMLLDRFSELVTDSVWNILPAGTIVTVERTE